MLVEKLKKDNIEAMKNKDKDARSVLSVVLTNVNSPWWKLTPQGNSLMIITS